MEKGTSWRSDASATRYANHDYADFAQEFLRRNPDYRRDFAATKDRMADNPAAALAEQEGLAGRWGLSFPQRAARRATRLSSSMVASGRARRRVGRDCGPRRDSATARFFGDRRP
jgi:hypothetical protein